MNQKEDKSRISETSIHDSNNTPIYKQLKDMILHDIESGKLRQGDKILSERMIAEQGNVSRMTARNAVSILEREGIVERRVGSGTYIARKFDMDFISFNSFSKELMIKGIKPGTKVINIETTFADLPMAKKLNIEPKEKMIMLERLRLGDDIPIAIEKSYIPYEYCEGIEEYIGENTSLYSILEEHYQIKLIKSDQYMHIAYSDEHASKLLRIKNASPCIFLESIAYDVQEQPIELMTSITRSDIVRYYSRLTLEN